MEISVDETSAVLTAWNGERFESQSVLAYKADGRIIVFSPALSLHYDSLSSGSQDINMEEWSYILAIGKPGDAFELKQVK